MKVENQYITLYQENRELINQHAAAPLNALRDEALDALQRAPLPTQKEEEYRHSDVAAAMAGEYGLNLKRLNLPIDPKKVFTCDVPNLHTSLHYLINDSYHIAPNNTYELPAGVVAGSLRAVAESHPELVQRYYGQIASTQQGGAVALNTLLAQDGFILYLPAGVVLEQPLQLINILHGEMDMMVNRRILVIAEERAAAKLLLCDHTIGAANYLVNQVVELYAAPSASIDFYDLEKNSLHTKRFSSLHATVESDANLVVNGITLTNGTTRNNYHICLNGKGANADLGGVAIANQQQLVDNYLYVDHVTAHCTSNQQFKYILDDAAKGSFTGRILVREGADKTVAYQSNKNLCLTPEASMHTKPQLEIYADDVKCSHGATVGQLDTNALFYMQTRGISYAEARMLLMLAFTSDVVEGIRIESLCDRLKQLIERRLRGENMFCSDCSIHSNCH